ncbi:MAG: hypothetical protein ACYTAO_08970 [Planctomycetota bacterium]
MSGSIHGTGTAADYAGGRGSCTACHSGASFSAMIAAGKNPSEFREVVDVTRQDCRACHQIHSSYTAADWALEATDPVALYAFNEVTFTGGKGNLCANCHQPRRTIDGYVDDVNGVTTVSSSHWGPHHGPQSAVILGVGGAGDVVGTPDAHAMLVRDTCVTCHIGANDNHTFEAVEESCVACHSDATNFDIGGVQTEVEALIVQLRDLLLAKGSLAAEAEEEVVVGYEGEELVPVVETLVVGYHPVKGTYPTAEAEALWNFIMIAIEDGSRGVHNPRYIKALLNASIAALQ